MGQQYLSPQRGGVPISSLLYRQLGGSSSFRISIFVSELTKTIPALLPPVYREQEFSGDIHPLVPCPGSQSTTPKGCPKNLKPRTSVRQVGSATGRLPTPTNTSTSWDLENKGFHGIPTPLPVLNGTTLPITTTESRSNFKTLRLSLRGEVFGSDLNLRFRPHQDYPCTFTPNFSRTRVYPGYPTPGYPARGTHFTTPMGCHQNLKPGTCVR